MIKRVSADVYVFKKNDFFPLITFIVHKDLTLIEIAF